MFPPLWHWIVGAIVATYIVGGRWLYIELVNAPEACQYYHWMPKGAKVCPVCKELGRVK
jgi:hypothetical protein